MKKFCKILIIVLFGFSLINNVYAEVNEVNAEVNANAKAGMKSVNDHEISEIAANEKDSKDSKDDKSGIAISNEKMTCEEILGKNLTNLLKAAITAFQIAAAIFAIVKGMTILIPPITAKDEGALKKAGGQLVTLAIVLAVAIIFRPLIGILGEILEWDVSCVI